MAYIDLVAVRLDPEMDLLIVQAPWCSPIEEGMTVMCETAQGEEIGTVEAVVHSDTNGNHDNNGDGSDDYAKNCKKRSCLSSGKVSETHFE